MKRTKQHISLLFCLIFVLLFNFCFFSFSNRHLNEYSKKIVMTSSSKTPTVYPCGQPFGVKMLSDGVMVIRLSNINGVCPAKEAGINVGDIIISINGEKITTNDDISKILSESKHANLKIKVKKSDGNAQDIELKAAYSSSDKEYKIGIWVRDSSAGIGTLTFYDEKTSTFCGLGHPICDSDTGEKVPLLSGEADKASITGVIKGKSGDAGALEGSFLNSKAIGKITDNSNCGIFGKTDTNPSKSEGIKLALNSEVKKGSAKILSTIDGTEPKEYDVHIEQVNQDATNNKNLIIRVTDDQLIKKTGGIVCGMSGSPIIQDGKLVGAITHVFTENPTMGFGIFAQTMYNQICEQTLSDYYAA